MDARITDPAALRLLSRTIILCSKLSEHLQLSLHPPHLTFRALTSSHSTSFHLRIHSSLFSHPAPPPHNLSTKLPARALLPIFRLPHNLQSLRISHPPSPDIVTFTTTTRSHLTKTFRVPVVDGRVPLAAFHKHKCTGLLTTRSNMLQELVHHLHARLDELTITPGLDSLRVASFVEDTANPANLMLRTEMIVAAREFDSYTVGNAADSPLTVYCKYFRAALDFCELIEEPIKLWFEGAGRPLMLEGGAKGNLGQPLFDATFVFASRLVEGDHVGANNRLQHAATEGAPELTDRGARLTATQIDVGETPRRHPISLARTPARSVNDTLPRLQSPLDTQGRVPVPSGALNAYEEDDSDEHAGDGSARDFVEGTPPP